MAGRRSSWRGWGKGGVGHRAVRNQSPLKEGPGALHRSLAFTLRGHWRVLGKEGTCLQEWHNHSSCRRSMNWSRQGLIGGHHNIPGRNTVAWAKTTAASSGNMVPQTDSTLASSIMSSESAMTLPTHTEHISQAPQTHQSLGIKALGKSSAVLNKAPTYSMAGGSQIQLQPNGTYIIKIFRWQGTSFTMKAEVLSSC